jgi:hypothetical protein
LLVGQTYTPLFYLVSNQVWGSDNDLVKFGGIYSGRQPMIQLAMGPLKIALVKPKAAGGVTPYTDTDTTMPKLEVAYSFKAGPVSLKPMFGYASYDEEDTVTGKSESIDSYILGIGFSGGFGAAYVKGSIYMGTNVANYGFYQDADGSADWDGTKVVDNDSMGYQLIVGFKASDMITVEGGFGSVESELDLPGTWEDEATAYYVNATINLAKGCFIVPEFGVLDHKDQTSPSGKTEQGDTTYFGAKWQINF